MSQISVLIVDDEKDIRISFRKLLEQNYINSVFDTDTISTMLEIIKENNIDIVLLDNHLGGGVEGHNYIEAIKKINSNIEIIMITSDRSLDLIIKSIKSGAFYYLTKDDFDLFELLTLIKKAYDTKKIKEEHQSLSDAYSVLQDNELKYELVTESPLVIEIMRKLEKLAKLKSTNCILISGENGVGKAELAKYYYSKIKESGKFKPFFKLASCSINRDNFKETFFGTATTKGIGEIANNAVILLEKVDQLQLEVQHLIVGLLKEDYFFIKGNKKEENRFTFICTSDRSLRQMVDNGLFSNDLYYELSSISFDVIPLRERKEDIVQLTNYFTQIFSKNLNIHFPCIPDSILSLLLNYSWPGNIPELHSVLEKLFILGFEDNSYNLNELPEKILAQKYLHSQSLSDNYQNAIKEIIEGSSPYRERIINCKKIIIELTLKKHNFIVAMAAKELQTNRCSLYREINELNIPYKTVLNLK